MTIFWMFNEDACTFERCDQQTALDAIDKEVPVIIRDDDVRVYMDGKFRRWPSEDSLIVAGIQFDWDDYGW